MPPDRYSKRRYLEAKRAVDDRALNRRVVDRFADALPERPGESVDDASADREDEVEGDASADRPPLRIVEIGCGLGAMASRLLEWDVLPERVEYTAVDADPECIAAAGDRIARRARGAGYAAERSDGGPTVGVEQSDAADPDGVRDRLVFRRGSRRVDLRLAVTDAIDLLARTDRTWDVAIGQAVFDLLDLDRAVPLIADALGGGAGDDGHGTGTADRGGLLYAPITFDGGTTFHPPVDRELDDRIERRYHRHMDEGRETPGGSRAGRRLLDAVRRFDGTESGADGGTVLAAGSSDWVVYPPYEGDEAYFLHHLVRTVGGALADDPAIDPELLDRWERDRHERIDRGELTYVAHQLDVAARLR